MLSKVLKGTYDECVALISANEKLSLSLGTIKQLQDEALSRCVLICVVKQVLIMNIRISCKHF